METKEVPETPRIAMNNPRASGVCTCTRLCSNEEIKLSASQEDIERECTCADLCSKGTG